MRKHLLAACLLALSCTAAIADEHAYPIANPAYKEECASCHIAYPPQLLPAASWKRLMAGLDRHFGSNASIDAQSAGDVGRYLEQNASRRAQAPTDAEPRISASAWFQKEHRKVPAATWKGASVRSAANCAACHAQAATGDYSERTLHVPR